MHSCLPRMVAIARMLSAPRPPQVVNMCVLNSMVDSAQVGYSYLGVTLDNMPVWLSEVPAKHIHTEPVALVPY